MEKKNWAIIDDDTVFHLTTRMLIHQNSQEENILTFNNGKEAIDFIKDHRHSPKELPDIILLDLYMPVMDGWDFIKEYLPLKDTINKNIAIYIVSSSVDMNDLQRAYEINAVKKYIIKPLSSKELNQIIDDYRAA